MVELVLQVDEPAVESLTDELVEPLQALSASVEDAGAAGPGEEPLFGEPGLATTRTAWRHSRVVALFADDATAQAAAAWLFAQDGGAGAVRIEALRPLAEHDWVRL